jgi:ABC-type transporter Mla subunit MlaD
MTTKQEAFNQIVELLAVVLEVEAPVAINHDDLKNDLESLIQEINGAKDSLSDLSYDVSELISNARSLESSLDGIDLDEIENNAQTILDSLNE